MSQHSHHPVTRFVPPASVADVPLAAVQGTLALDLGPYDFPRPPELTLVADTPDDLTDVDVRGWAGRFCQAVVEVATGHRAASQLVRWTSPAVYADVARRALLHHQAVAAGRRDAQARPSVRSVHVCSPARRCVEVSVHVRQGARSRALAARLERQGDRWVCTAVEFG